MSASQEDKSKKPQKALLPLTPARDRHTTPGLPYQRSPAGIFFVTTRAAPINAPAPDHVIFDEATGIKVAKSADFCAFEENGATPDSRPRRPATLFVPSP